MYNPKPDPTIEEACAIAFGKSIYFYQKDIINASFRSRKTTIRATTRAGKSYCMAMVAILRATLLPNHPVGIIAPTHDKTRIIMNYVADLLAANPMFDEWAMVSTEGLTKLERLRKEVSKKRITGTNGSAIQCLSVDLDARGFGVMGWAFPTVIVDETDMIDDESYTKIFRMLLENPDACIIEIGNPFTLGHFYRHHNDENWHKIHIDAEDCVKAGRLTREAVDEQRAEMTELEATVLLDANFPEEIEYAVFPKKSIDEMVKFKPEPEKFDKIIIGIDPAAGGRDRTVITPFGVKGNEYWQLVRDCITMDERDAMKIVGRAQELVTTKYGSQKVEIATDTVNNRGIYDRLKENGYLVREFIAGKKAYNHKRFCNYKTEVAFKCAEIGKLGLIHNVPAASRYVLQLRAWTYEVRSDKQIKIVDPEEKSPDHADSLIIALSNDIFHEDMFMAAPIDTSMPEWRWKPVRDRIRPQ